MQTLPATLDNATPKPPRQLVRIGMAAIPALFADTGPKGAERFIEFFTATIRNKNTRMAYARAVVQFADWCQGKGLTLATLRPVVIAAYIEELGTRLSKPTVKQHLAAIRMLFDYLVTGHVMDSNPAHSVRGPTHVVREGKTPVLTAKEARLLLDTIDHMRDEEGKPTIPRAEESLTLTELRDRALIAVMVYSFARVSAVVGMNVEDYFRQDSRWWFRLHEKGGKRHKVPAHHNAERSMELYLTRIGLMRDGQLVGDKKTPLFRSVDRSRQLTDKRLGRFKALAMIKRRAKAAGLPDTISCHTFRATGITAYLSNGGTIEQAQRIAAHESPRTTKLYDRTRDEVSLDEVEKIQI